MLAVGVGDILPGQLDALQAVGQRQHKERMPNPHQQPIDDRQGQRQAQRHRGPHSLPAGHVEGAAQRLHPLPHHIHSHPAPGDIAHLRVGRQSGKKDQLHLVFVR